jgi:hypothetical protein
VEQCIAFALNSELSLSVGNDNVLLNNVSTVFTGDVMLCYFGILTLLLMIFRIFFIADFSKVQLNTKDIRCMG